MTPRNNAQDREGTAECAVHKHSQTYCTAVCPTCERYVPDATKVLTAYHDAVERAQGCRELTCIYHHHANTVRRDCEHIMRGMGWSVESLGAVTT